ncbi:complement regulatory protein [Trypanosoma conorhini]|uniref:Complement regulatory protein n=1 Tax=Trypanosoma conorhini TaxID=83891 RepID=A0A422MV14_9TRYP|nr:complement regulatory protein [Trypanosoma conorhini]RNE97084.1 complement regulatory protein [Trypanosoma conorhini]
MPRHLFYSAMLLLFVLLLCCGNVGGAAPTNVSQSDGTKPSGGAQGNVYLHWDDVSQDGGTVHSLRSPSLVEVGGEVFVIAEADSARSDGASVTGVASASLKQSRINVEVSALATDALNVRAQLLMEETAAGKAVENAVRPTTVVTDGHVCMVLGNASRVESAGSQPGKKNVWELLMVKGEVRSEDGAQAREVQWSNTSILTLASRVARGTSLTHLAAGGGSGVAMEDGTLVFPLQATSKEGKVAALSVRSKGPGKNWVLSKGTTAEGCADPAIVEWTAGKLFMLTACDDGYYRLYGSVDRGGTWLEEAEGLLAILGANAGGERKRGVRCGFVAASIAGKEVMLLTLPVYTEAKDDKRRGELHLFVTDNQRIFDVGSISRQGEDATASSLLLQGENGELISLYERSSDGEARSLVSVRLGAELGLIKTLAKAWAALDNALSTCTATAEDGLLSQRICLVPMPTRGLAGLLSGPVTGNKWRDAYFGANALVKDGVSAARGVTFKGPGAGAKWPVGDQGSILLFPFADSQFTLAATVTIHEAPTGDLSPLLGLRVSETDTAALFGLSYSHERTWTPVIGTEPVRLEEVWEPHKSYQVTLVLDSDACLVYVDGALLYEGEAEPIAEVLDVHRAPHFYIGGYGASDAAAAGIHVTVANVLWYNRALRDEEVAALATNKESLLVLEADKLSWVPEIAAHKYTYVGADAPHDTEVVSKNESAAAPPTAPPLADAEVGQNDAARANSEAAPRQKAVEPSPNEVAAQSLQHKEEALEDDSKNDTAPSVVSAPAVAEAEAAPANETALPNKTTTAGLEKNSADGKTAQNANHSNVAPSGAELRFSTDPTPAPAPEADAPPVQNGTKLSAPVGAAPPNASGTPVPGEAPADAQHIPGSDEPAL